MTTLTKICVRCKIEKPVVCEIESGHFVCCHLYDKQKIAEPVAPLQTATGKVS